MSTQSDQGRDQATRRVIQGLKNIYKSTILPLEQMYMYDAFYSPALSDSEFDSKPMVMLVGQYSTGKTSFIRYLIGRDFPGQRIGPEPTTDRFVAVMDGPEERVIPGNAMAVAGNLPFRGLDRFGVSFLNRFEGSVCPSEVLRNIHIVDTPGVLAGNKQTVARGYDFTNVCGWFAERADLILLLFDAHKLDISDEFKEVIEKLRGHDDKIRCVLNKADQVDRQKLMRVYGALMWSMGKVMKTPEVLRVYVGSFWDHPLMYRENKELFEMEEKDLMKDLKDLPRNSAMRKINELVKRTRLLRVHAYIIGYLKEQMPIFMGREKMQERLLRDLPSVFRNVLKQHHLAPGDFPDLDNFRTKLLDLNFSKFPKIKNKMLADLSHILETQIPALMERLPKTTTALKDEKGNEVTYSMPLPVRDYDETFAGEKWNKTSGASDDYVPPPLADHAAPSPPLYPSPNRQQERPQSALRNSGGGVRGSTRLDPSPPPTAEANPFDDEEEEGGAEGGKEEGPWVLASKMLELQPLFASYAPSEEGFLSGAAAKKALVETGVDKKVLRELWPLADMDRDGLLDLEEFTVAMQLVEDVKEGKEVPEFLPDAYVPRGKRAYVM
ncbi:hypothetical protein NSK_005726 [Nannochloropsis salina CCMP1776]|uniref:Uncharacterized protein n=1 Tax=Nannochloropsis salina CCMP1776 TaxID=1027361 RepID=A0A4D9CZB1_9STRA|nr:hypothetical protein NSK_005726 [Nannochloropsis salina CCMP1776]|eukprot:TFJ82953.1 hypothetical protein NSK_005726 [Nannochloropsis salina CCMP1776]